MIAAVAEAVANSSSKYALTCFIYFSKYVSARPSKYDLTLRTYTYSVMAKTHRPAAMERMAMRLLLAPDCATIARKDMAD